MIDAHTATRQRQIARLSGRVFDALPSEIRVPTWMAIVGSVAFISTLVGIWVAK